MPLYQKVFNFFRSGEEAPESQYIYFWDDITLEQDIYQRKTFREFITENQITLLFVFSLILAPLPLIFHQLNLDLVAVITTMLLVMVLVISQLLNTSKYQKVLELLKLRSQKFNDLDFSIGDEFIFDMVDDESIINLNSFRDTIIAILRQLESSMQNSSLMLKTLENATNQVNSLLEVSIQSMEDSTSNVGVFQEIRGYTGLTSTGVDRLTEALDQSVSVSLKAGKILKSIGKQVQMLALNAGIEASRSEQLGVGFEVVASNLRRLSSHTIDSSDELRDDIKNVNDQAKKAIELITNSMVQVESKIGYSHQNLSNIEEDLNKVNGLVNSLKLNHESLSISIRQIRDELAKFKY